jgi:hypothetical protein
MGADASGLRSPYARETSREMQEAQNNKAADGIRGETQNLRDMPTLYRCTADAIGGFMNGVLVF